MADKNLPTLDDSEIEEISDRDIEEPASDLKEPGTFGKILNLLGYPGRIVRTAAAAAGSEDIAAGDVASVAASPLHVAPETVSGKELLDVYPSIKSALIGKSKEDVLQDIEKIPDPQLREYTRQKLLQAEKPEFPTVEGAAGFITEVGTDPLTYPATTGLIAKGLAPIATRTGEVVQKIPAVQASIAKSKQLVGKTLNPAAEWIASKWQKQGRAIPMAKEIGETSVPLTPEGVLLFETGAARTQEKSVVPLLEKKLGLEAEEATRLGSAKEQLIAERRAAISAKKQAKDAIKAAESSSKELVAAQQAEKEALLKRLKGEATVTAEGTLAAPGELAITARDLADELEKYRLSAGAGKGATVKKIQELESTGALTLKLNPSEELTALQTELNHPNLIALTETPGIQKIMTRLDDFKGNLNSQEYAELEGFLSDAGYTRDLDPRIQRLFRGARKNIKNKFIKSVSDVSTSLADDLEKFDFEYSAAKEAQQGIPAPTVTVTGELSAPESAVFVESIGSPTARSAAKEEMREVISALNTLKAPQVAEVWKRASRISTQLAEAGTPISITDSVKLAMQEFLKANPQLEQVLASPLPPSATKAAIQERAASMLTPEQLAQGTRERSLIRDIERYIGELSPQEVSGKPTVSTSLESILRDLPTSAPEASVPSQLLESTEALVPGAKQSLKAAAHARERADLAARMASPAVLEQLPKGIQQTVQQAGKPSRILNFIAWNARQQATKGGTLAGNLAKLGDPDLVKLGEELLASGNKSMKPWGEALVNISNKDTIARNGIIYALTDQPEFRKMMKVAGEGAESEKPAEYVPPSPLTNDEIREEDIEETDEE